MKVASNFVSPAVKGIVYTPPPTHRWSVFAMALRVGCKVSVKATFFDEDEHVRWSEAQFGDEWDSAYVVGEVRMVYKERVRVWFAFDKTSYKFSRDVVTHDALTCPVCASGGQEEDPSSDSEGA